MNNDSDQLTVANHPPNVKNLVAKAKKIYTTVKDQLEPLNNGKYVVIEVESTKYFIGDTKDEAMEKARKKFPHILLFVRRIGEIEKNSHHSSSFSPLATRKYASLF